MENILLCKLMLQFHPDLLSSALPLCKHTSGERRVSGWGKALVCEQDEKLGTAQRGGKCNKKYNALPVLTQGQIMKVNVGKF